MSIEYNAKALQIDHLNLPPAHQNIGATLLNMGIAYKHKGDHEKALEYYYKAREIYKRSYPPTHQNFLFLKERTRASEVALTRN